MNIGTSPYINNPLFISLLFFRFLKTKYFHRNLGTYKIGGAPPHNTLGFCWGRSLKIHREIRELFTDCGRSRTGCTGPFTFWTVQFSNSFLYLLFYFILKSLFLKGRRKKNIFGLYLGEGSENRPFKKLTHSLGLQASG
jgi:hypothetical protein